MTKTCVIALSLSFFACTGLWAGTGDISVRGSEVWRAADGPHAVQGIVTVEPDATLTIEAGAIVEFAANLRAGIDVKGHLKVQGTPDNPAIMRLAPTQSSRVRAYWRGVWVEGSAATADFSNVRLSGAETGVEVRAGAATLNSVDAADSVRALVARGAAAHLTVNGGDIERNSFGLDAFDGATATVSGVIFANNRTAVSSHGATVNLRSNSFQSNQFSLASSGSGRTAGAGNRLLVNGNARETTLEALTARQVGSAVSSSISTDTTWALADSPVMVSGDIDVALGATLTIESGVVVKFQAGGGSGLTVHGRLVVAGTSANPVYLTSALDPDSKVNAFPTSLPGMGPLPGDWEGIRIVGSEGSSSISDAVVRYARNAVSAQGGASATLSRNSLRNSLTGLSVEDGAVVTSSGDSFIGDTVGLSADTGKIGLASTDFRANAIAAMGSACATACAGASGMNAAVISRSGADLLPRAAAVPSNLMPSFASLTGWNTDRYDPASFTAVTGVNGRNAEVQIGISSAQGQAFRPAAFQSQVYGYQGKNHSVAGVGAGDFVSADIYVPSGLNISANGNAASYLWAIGSNGSDFSVIGFTNSIGHGGFSVWDDGTGAFVDLPVTGAGAVAVNYNAWNTVSVQFTGATFDYYVNGVKVYSMTTNYGSTKLTSTVLDAVNFFDPTTSFIGLNYTITWADTPTPQTITFGPLSAVSATVGSVSLSATASSTLAVTFSSSTPAVCTVSGTSAIILTAGTCTIAANQAGNPGGTPSIAPAATVTQSFSVNLAPQTITFAPLVNVNLSAGSVQLNAIATSGLPVAFASTTSTVCTVSGATLTLIAAGTCSVSASQTGNGVYAPAASASQSFAVAARILISASTLPNGVQNVAYSQTLTASGGTGAFTWTVIAGSLPTGVSLGSAGALSGTPTASGSFSFTVQATDAGNTSAQQALSILINPALSITTTTLTSGVQGVAYSQTLTAAGGTGSGNAWTVSAGALPAGLTLSTGGVLAGTPTANGQFSFTAKVTDSSNATATQALSLQIGAPLSITTSGALPQGITGAAYSGITFAAAGGTGGPYTWSVSAGTLPPGLSLSSAGALSGNASAAGSYNFTVSVNDGVSPAATKAASLTVYAVLSITTASFPNGLVGSNYTQTLASTGGSGTVTWAATGLPGGATLSTAGVLSSNAFTAAGTFQIAVTVTDSVSGQKATATIPMTVLQPTTALTVGPSTLVVGAGVGGTLSGAFTATGGTPPYKFTGSVPAGVVLATGGSIGGSSSQAGNVTVTVTVTDSAATPATATAQLTINILGLTTSTTLPAGAATAPYAATFAAAGGTQPYAFSATGLPAGFVLSGDGQLTGTPAAAGPLSFTVQVGDSRGLTSSATYTLTVQQAPVSVTTTSLPNATVGAGYSQVLAAKGGNPPYSWSVLSGILPVGLSLSAGGTISGNPTAPGPSSFVAQVTDATGGVATFGESILVSPVPLTITTSSLPAGMVGVPYPPAIIGASGGTPPYAFAITSGGLPSGISISGGNISSTGTGPTTAGDFPLTVTVTDSAAVSSKVSLSITVRPSNADLLLDTSSLSFSVLETSTILPGPQTIDAQATIATTPVTFRIDTTPDWLSVTSGSNSGLTTPAVLTASLKASALVKTQGTYADTFTVTCTSASCNGRSQTVAVTLRVTAPPPQLSVSGSLLSLTSSSTPPSTQTLKLNYKNSGGGTLTVTSVTCGASWCTTKNVPASNTLKAGEQGIVTITADPSTLSTGFYSTTLNLTTSAGSASIPVNFFISQIPSMVMAPTGTQFSMQAGGAPGNANGSFQLNLSSGSGSFTAAVAPGAAWLTVGTPSGNVSSSSPATVAFSVNSSAASLAAGAYYGSITATIPNVSNSPQTFLVVLNVTPAAAASTLNPRNAGLVFLTTVGGAPAAQTVNVYSSSTAPTTYTASASTATGSWLAVSPTLGTTSSASPGKSTVTVNTTGLTQGVYKGSVIYASSAAGASSVNVTLVVQPVSGASANTVEAGLLPNAASPRATCSPTTLIATQTGLVDSFSVATSWPTPLAINLYNDCALPVANAQVQVTFTNGDAPIQMSLVDAATGLYSATWIPGKVAAQVNVAAQASVTGFPDATAVVTGNVLPTSGPVINPNAVVSPYNPVVGAPLTPGAIVSIYGSNLASQTTQPSTIPLPTAVNGTSVLIGGIASPLFYVSPGQINVQVPFQLNPANQYQVVVNANGALTAAQTVQLAPAAPGAAIYLNGNGTLIAQHASDFSLVTATSPAKQGEFIVLYLVGMGPTDVSVASGAASPTSPLARPTSIPTLSLGGKPVPILFAGLTPSLVGLYQINIQIPTVATGGNLLLTVSQNGVASNTAILPVAY